MAAPGVSPAVDGWNGGITMTVTDGALALPLKVTPGQRNGPLCQRRFGLINGNTTGSPSLSK